MLVAVSQGILLDQCRVVSSLSAKSLWALLCAPRAHCGHKHTPVPLYKGLHQGCPLATWLPGAKCCSDVSHCKQLVWFTASISAGISVLGLLILVMNRSFSSQGSGFRMFPILILSCGLNALWWLSHEKQQSGHSLRSLPLFQFVTVCVNCLINLIR